MAQTSSWQALCLLRMYATTFGKISYTAFLLLPTASVSDGTDDLPNKGRNLDAMRLLISAGRLAMYSGNITHFTGHLSSQKYL
ncbi:MAG: hypothetical protein CYG59_11365 [Chloroflexi bacterium]|nr:MAG: hypothetical protein CYG59_11365 [Chloroflexota bacterium]